MSNDICAAIDNLRENQKQLDMDGCMVGVSRQALDQVLQYIADLVPPRPTDKDAQEALEILEGKYFWNGLQYIKDFIGDRRYEVIRAALSAPSREAKLVEALKEAADNYLAVVCNSQQADIDEVKSDPIVKTWYDLLSEHGKG